MAVSCASPSLMTRGARNSQCRYLPLQRCWRAGNRKLFAPAIRKNRDTDLSIICDSYRLEKVMMWGNAIHGHICESLPSSSSPSPSQSQSPSAILSRYFDKPVHLVFKGSRPRPCDPTPVFPDLKATAVFQDGYPLLVASEESLLAVETELRGHVGKQGVDERWKSDRLVIERSVLGDSSRFFNCAWLFWERMQSQCTASASSTVFVPRTCLLPSLRSAKYFEIKVS